MASAISIGAIVGGVLGGITLIILIIFGVIGYKHIQKKSEIFL